MPKSTIGVVYFVAAPALQAVKIGFTILTLAERVKQLQQSMPIVELKLIGSRPGLKKLETWYHRCFESTQIKGEWFRYDSMMVLAALGLVLPTRFKKEWRLLWDDDPRVKDPKRADWLGHAPKQPPPMEES